MQNKAFIIGTAIVVTAAVVFGLLTVGGPLAAKRDKYDLLRYQDLKRIEAALLCSNWRILRPELPDQLTPEDLRSYCGGVEIRDSDLRDNETGEPYSYRHTDKDFTVCAKFYDAEKAMSLAMAGGRGSFNPETGCVTGRVR